MLIWIIYALASVGFWYVVGASAISQVPREKLAGAGGVGKILVSLLECAGCFGVWTGAAASFFGIFSLSLPHVPALIVTALFTCASNLILARLFGA